MVKNYVLVLLLTISLSTAMVCANDIPVMVGLQRPDVISLHGQWLFYEKLG